MYRKFVILLTFLLIACQKSENKKIPDSENQKTTLTKQKPLFLSLFPEMSNIDFKNQIKKLNSQGILTESKFPMIINNNEYNFEILKKPNSIVLYYDDYINDKNSSDDYVVIKKHEKYGKLFNSKINEILSLFDKKYSLYEFQIPENLDLRELNLSSEDYRIYNDNDKFIIIGYSNITFASPKDIEEMFGIKPNEEKTGMGKAYDQMASREDLKFDLEININYYRKEEFLVILKKIKKIYADYESEIEKDKLINENKNNNKNRI